MAAMGQEPEVPRTERGAHGPSTWTLAAGAGLVGVLFGAAAVYLGGADRRASAPIRTVAPDVVTPPSTRSEASDASSAPDIGPAQGGPAAALAGNRAVGGANATVAGATLLRSGVAAEAPSLVRAVNTTRGAVVNIGAAGTLGAGVIVDAGGTVLTNHHVIAGALRAPRRGVFDAGARGFTRDAPGRPTVSVSFEDGREVPALIVVADAEQDLAILRLISGDPEERFTAVALGASAAVDVGQEVFAIGNPFGLSHTVSRGIVSAVDRASILPNRVPLLQLDASINVGNSGGPLFDLSGNLLGIITAKRRDAQGIAFAVPVDHLRGFLRAVVDPVTGRRSGAIGVVMDWRADLPEGARALGYEAGLSLSTVERGGPAQTAGLVLGDVLVSLRGKRLDGMPEAGDPEALGRSVVASVRSLFPGEVLEVSVVRGDEVRAASIQIGAATPERQALIDAEELLGLQLEPGESAGSGPPAVTGVLSRSQLFLVKELLGARVVKLMDRDIASIEDLGKELALLRSLVRAQAGTVQVLVGFARDDGSPLGELHVNVD